MCTEAIIENVTLKKEEAKKAILACSYDSSELEDIDSIKSELMSWKNTDDLLIELGVFKKL